MKKELFSMNNENGDNTKGKKRAEKSFREKHRMKVTGKSALLWEKLKNERAEKLKKIQKERKRK